MVSTPTRLSVRLSSDTRARFQRLADATGCSLSKAIEDWLVDTSDATGALAELLEKARKEPLLAARELQAHAIGLTDLTTDLLREIRRRSGGGTAALPEAGAGPAAARRPLTPPVGNTGGKVPPRKRK